MSFKTIEWTGESLLLIDQTVLPTREEYREYTDYLGVADSIRDMVVRGELQVRAPGKEYWVGTRCEPDYLPEKEGVIRIRDCSAHFHLKAVGSGKVWVEYVVQVDPGGRLPSWLVRVASKNIPGGTLADLQLRLDETRGMYGDTVARLVQL